MAKGTRALFQITSMMLGAIVVSLVCFEVVLRCLNLYQAPPNPLRPARPDLFQADEKIGYRLWRSTKYFDRYPPGNPEVIPMNSNSEGFRYGREYGEPDSRRRILVVGDSFVFGAGVRPEDRLTEVLESLEPSWRVDNLGMAGWGIDLMIRAIEHVGVKARPNLTVLCILTDDFRRVLPHYAGMGYPIPKYELKGGNLVTVPYPAATGWPRLRVVQFAYTIYWRYLSDRNRYDLNRALLERFLVLSRQQRSRPVVVFLPGRADTEEDRARRGFLSEWAASRKIPFLDLTDPIHGAGVDNVYLKGNWHWNAAGHRIAAQELHAFLRAEIANSP